MLPPLWRGWNIYLHTFVPFKPSVLVKSPHEAASHLKPPCFPSSVFLVQILTVISKRKPKVAKKIRPIIMLWISYFSGYKPWIFAVFLFPSWNTMAFPSGRPGSATTPPGDALRWHPGPPRAPDRCGTNLPPQRTPKNRARGWIWLDFMVAHGIYLAFPWDSI